MSLIDLMKKNRLKIAFIGIGVFIILALLGAPSMIKSYVVKNSPELLGRQIDLGTLKYNYFTSTAQAYGFKMFELNGEDIFVSFDTLILDLEPLKYLQNEVAIEQFYVRGLYAKMITENSNFNFQDLIDFYSGTDTVDVKAANGEVLKYQISNIEFKHTDFLFEDKDINKLTEIRDAALFIPFIGWDQNSKSTADLAFDLARGGSFKSNFKFDPNNGDYEAAIEVKQLYIDPFFDYVKEYAAINSLDGRIDVKVDLIGNAYELEKTLASVDATAFDFEMKDSTDKLFLGAEETRFLASKIDYFNSNYEIDKIEIQNSFTFFQLDSASNNFFRIFRLDDEPDSVDAEGSSGDSLSQSTLQYSIGELILHQGRLDYTDNLTGEPFNYQLSEMEIDSKNLTNASDWLKINSTMLLNNRGSLTASLGINPQDYDNLELDITVEKFLLPDLNIYTNYYMGHSVLEGDMYYYSNSTIVDGQIVSENRLLVKEAKLETTGAGLYSLPLKFAFFLLTDRNGDVDLDIPVRGDLNDPSLKLSTIIWDTFKNVIDKTVLAPVDFLVGLVGGDPKELEEMVFAYTDTIPSDKQYRQLSKLVDLEQKKDGLSILMNFYVDDQLYNEAIAKEILGTDFNGEKRDYLKDTEEFKEYVFEQIGTDSLTLNTAILELTKNQNLDSIREVRTQTLLDRISEHLKEEKPTTKISILMGDSESPLNVGAYPKFLISYDLLGAELDSISRK